MSEFFNPNKESENYTATGTGYAEPSEPINIVVDDGQPRFCSSCGAPLEPGDVFCSKCGNRMAVNTQPVQSGAPGAHIYPGNGGQSAYDSRTQGAQFGQPTVVNNYYYTNSGNTVNTNSNNTAVNVNGDGKVKNKYISLLLCFFLGVLGAHRFYEGKIPSGILYACTGGLFGVGWIIDLIILLFKPRWYTP